MKHYYFKYYINQTSLDQLVDFINELKDDSLTLYIETLGGSVSAADVIKEMIANDDRIAKVVFVGDCGSYALDLLAQAMRSNKCVISKNIEMTVHLTSRDINTSELLKGRADSQLEILHKSNIIKLQELKDMGFKKKHLKKIAKYEDVTVDYDYLMKLVY